jgi:ADP-ribosylglycohydrolase
MRFFLKPGQWTDDASMALCIADSLLVRSREQGLDCRDLRLRFLNWWDWGYNNALDLAETFPCPSVSFHAHEASSQRQVMRTPQETEV